MPPARAHTNPRLPRLSVALTAAATLALEVLLTRLFSIVQWHHFAYMVISIALLGFGASGTALALAPALASRFRATFPAALTLFGATTVPAFLIAQRIAVHPEQLVWDPSQLLRVSAVYVLLAVPFFFAATAIGLALVHYRASAARVYGADLIGAGAGSVGIVALMYVVSPMAALAIVAVLGLVAAVIGALEAGSHRHALIAPGVVACGLLAGGLMLPAPWFAPALSPYKALSQQLAVIDSRTEAQASSPLGWLTVVASPAVPLRHAPGLSLNSTANIPEQRAIYIDGDAMTPIDRYRTSDDAAYLDDMTSALPYHVRSPDTVLVLGAGGGTLVRQALWHDTPSVTAVELDPELIGLVRDAYRDFSGGLYELPAVTVEHGEARGFLAGRPVRYDLIQLALIDSFAASSAGLHALSEDYLYTVEALGEYYEHLTDDGLLAITRWIKLPPRDALKLLAIAIDALRAAGVADPGSHLLLIRGWQTSTLLVSRSPFDAAAIERATAFCRERAFDLAWYAGMPAALANRYNRLAEPYLYDGARALLGPDAAQFASAYKFNIAPATDDKPYFSYFFKWRTLPELIELRGRGGTALLESGYLIVIATLAQALIIGAGIIVAPLWRRMRDAGVRRSRFALYFTALGLGFLFIEIAFIQKFVLFLHHPVLAVATALSGFLVFAGIGSLAAGRCDDALKARVYVRSAVAAIAALGTVYAFVVPATVFAPLVGAPLALKVALSLGLIALLAVPMGMLFPLGVARLDARAPALIPVAWAINGAASVVSAVLAAVLAIHFGFTAVVLTAIALYALAALTFEY